MKTRGHTIITSADVMHTIMDMHQANPPLPAQVRNRWFADRAHLGQNIMRWCALCCANKSQGGGHMRFVLGGRHWVCAKHQKVAK